MTVADEYTPTTEDVRLGYGIDEWGGLRDRWADEFDRWLAAHDRETAARAWDEGYADYLEGPAEMTNPYREEADR